MKMLVSSAICCVSAACPRERRLRAPHVKRIVAKAQRYNDKARGGADAGLARVTICGTSRLALVSRRAQTALRGDGMNLAKVLGDVGFPAADREKWRMLAEKGLAGATFEDAVSSRTDDGILIEPIYARDSDPSFLPRRNPD